MLDIGFTKLLIIGGLALVVIGPERLPRVARTAGTLLGRAQRYVADVKAEVNRSMEIEELKRTKQEFDASVNDLRQSVDSTVADARSALGEAAPSAWHDSASAVLGAAEGYPVYRHPKKNWRIKRAALPYWYKQQHGVRAKAQSGAARVARFRPGGLNRPPRP
jgi:sec-independent protein translocase protein TatB